MPVLKSPISAFRLLVEIVLAVAAAEFVVMFILPVVAPGVTGATEAALDASMLSVIAGPLILWRMRAAIVRAQGDNNSAASTAEWRLKATTGLIVGVGSALAVACGVNMHASTIAEAKARFSHQVASEVEQISDRVHRVGYGLKGARGAYAVSGTISRADFQRYVASRDLPQEFPGAEAFGFIKHVMPGDVESFVAAERADGAPDFAIHGNAAYGYGVENTADLYIVAYIEPYESMRTARGFDVGSNPEFRAAIERAIATGEPTISGGVLLPHDPQHRLGFHYYIPVYRNGTVPPTQQERFATLEGVLYACMVLEDTLAGLDTFDSGHLDVELFEGVRTSRTALLYDRDGDLAGSGDFVGTEHDKERLFSRRETLSIGGGEWTILARSSPKFEAEINRWIAPTIGIGGILLSMLTGAIVWSMGTGRSRAIALAETMNTDLSASLREVESFRTAIESMTIVSEANKSGRITAVNDQFCKISGYAREELLGQDHRIVNSGTHPRTFWVGMWKTIASGRPWRGEVCNRKKDGSIYWVDSIVVPFMGADGKVERYISIRMEVTDRKEAEAALVKSMEDVVAANIKADSANRAKSEFLANMSHEIRTPLTAILGFADVLREDGNLADAPPSRIETIDTIRNAGQHLLTIINDILDLSKIEANKMEVERVDTPLAGTFHEVTSLMRPRAASKQIDLNAVLDTPIPDRILSDPTRLRQILMNLVGNAVKFTKEGSVTLSVRTEKGRTSVEPSGVISRDWLIVDVIDTGPGMTPVQADRLFHAFTQADTSVTRQHGGSGLGLTICRRLAMLMGGNVALVATDPGKGSTFRVELPLVAAPDAKEIERLDVVIRPSDPTKNAAAVVLNGRILLAEDGVDNQRLISFHLRKAGATVDIAENGVVAIDMLDKAKVAGTPYAILLTDIQMPEMDGYTLTRKLRRRGEQLPIVALTAHAMAEDQARCIEAGCDDYASKPIDKAALITVCDKWLKARTDRRTAA